MIEKINIRLLPMVLFLSFVIPFRAISATDQPIVVNVLYRDSVAYHTYSLNGKLYQFQVILGEPKNIEEISFDRESWKDVKKPVTDSQIIKILKDQEKTAVPAINRTQRSVVGQLEVFEKLPLSDGKLLPGHHLIDGRFLVEVTDKNEVLRWFDTQENAAMIPVSKANQGIGSLQTSDQILQAGITREEILSARLRQNKLNSAPIEIDEADILREIPQKDGVFTPGVHAVIDGEISVSVNEQGKVLMVSAPFNYKVNLINGKTLNLSNDAKELLQEQAQEYLKYGLLDNAHVSASSFYPSEGISPTNLPQPRKKSKEVSSNSQIAIPAAKKESPADLGGLNKNKPVAAPLSRDEELCGPVPENSEQEKIQREESQLLEDLMPPVRSQKSLKNIVIP